jgi:hypothetical protein
MAHGEGHSPALQQSPRRPRRGSLIAGWVNVALGFLVGFATTVGFLAGRLSGAESPFFILIACLLVAVGAFALAVRPAPVFILGASLLFFGVFLGLGLFVGGSVFGTTGGAGTVAVGAAGLALAAVEAVSILAVWRDRRRRVPVTGPRLVRGTSEPPDVP